MSILLYETYTLEEIIELVAEQRFDEWFEDITTPDVKATISWDSEIGLKDPGSALLSTKTGTGVPYSMAAPTKRALSWSEYVGYKEVTLSFAFMLRLLGVEDRHIFFAGSGSWPYVQWMIGVKADTKELTLAQLRNIIPTGMILDTETWHVVDLQINQLDKLINAVYINSELCPLPPGWEWPLTTPAVYSYTSIGVWNNLAFGAAPSPFPTSEIYFDDFELRTGFWKSPPPKEKLPIPWWLIALLGGIGGVSLAVVVTRKPKKKEKVVTKW